jgi:hypothetical protein
MRPKRENLNQSKRCKNGSIIRVLVARVMIGLQIFIGIMSINIMKIITTILIQQY